MYKRGQLGIREPASVPEAAGVKGLPQGPTSNMITEQAIGFEPVTFWADPYLAGLQTTRRNQPSLILLILCRYQETNKQQNEDV